VREFINERIGVQARDDAHSKAISKLEEDKLKEKEDAIATALVMLFRLHY
jgi:hypothetical protein